MRILDKLYQAVDDHALSSFVSTNDTTVCDNFLSQGHEYCLGRSLHNSFMHETFCVNIFTVVETLGRRANPHKIFTNCL